MTANTTRRTALRSGLAGVASIAGTLLPAGLGTSAPLAVRRDINTLAPDDPIILTYAAAVRYLRLLPSGDRRSWNNLTSIHMNWCTHQNWYLLPWHREYLLALERIIQSLPMRAVPRASEFSMPYWDWTRNPRLPTAFTRRTLNDGSANPLLDRSRRVGPNAVIPAELIGTAAMRSVYGAPTFETFASSRPAGQNNTNSSWQRVTSAQGFLEATPHNGVHNWIGGNMLTMASPRDPIFFLHHANIDRIWASWNAHGNMNTSATAWLNFTFTQNFVQPNGVRYNRRVRDINMSTYSYERLDPRVSKASQSSAPARKSLTLPATNGGSRLSSTVMTQQINIPKRHKWQSTAVLKILGITVPPQRVMNLVRVFVNHPGPNEDTPPDGPFFLGSLAFFTGSGRIAGDASLVNSDICTPARNCFSFDLPLTEMLNRWQAEDLLLGESLTVQLVTVGPMRERSEPSAKPASIHLEFL